MKKKLIFGLVWMSVLTCSIAISTEDELAEERRRSDKLNLQLEQLNTETLQEQEKLHERIDYLERQLEVAETNFEISTSVIRTLDAALQQKRLAEEQEPEVLFDIPLSDDLQRYTYATCEEYGVVDKFDVVLAIMSLESNFDPSLISKTNDYGLMQINICNHEWLKEKLQIVDFLNPEQNIKAGVYMFSELVKKYDGIHKVLMAYNKGEGGAAALWKQNIYSTPYSRATLNRLSQLQ